MININVFSEEKAWSKRIKNKDLFFKKICKAFPEKYKFSNKKVSLTLLLSNNKNMSGLLRSKELLGHLSEISVIDFDYSDVVRHPLVSKIVKAYSSNDKY